MLSGLLALFECFGWLSVWWVLVIYCSQVYLTFLFCLRVEGLVWGWYNMRTCGFCIVCACCFGAFLGVLWVWCVLDYYFEGFIFVNLWDLVFRACLVFCECFVRFC